MDAIPTIYNSAIFRSRLEARWAAMFDLLKWPWVYEPLDLNGYIPDFVLQFHKPLLVEVKPAFSAEELIGQAVPKIEASGWEHEALIVGVSPVLQPRFPPWGFNGEGPLGYLAQRGDTDLGSWEWGNAVPMLCLHCDKPSLYHEDLTWSCRVTGCYDGNGHISEPPDLRALWNQAANAVRWLGSEAKDAR